MNLDLGYIKVASASPRMRVADVDYNVDEIIKLMQKAKDEKISLICFPELCISGYTCQDLFLQSSLQRAALEGLARIVDANIDICAVVSLPINVDGSLFNCAVAVSGGKILGVVPKTHIPNYSEYYERRWFSQGSVMPKTIKLFGQDIPSGLDLIFNGQSDYGDIPFAIEICEDLWAPIPPSGYLAQGGALIILNPSASTALVAKHGYRKGLLSQQSGRCICGYVYSGASHDESTTDVVFSGYCSINENASLLVENERFRREGNYITSDIDVERLKFLRGRNKSFFYNTQTEFRKIAFDIKGSDEVRLTRKINPYPFLPIGDTKHERLEEISNIQSCGLIKRLEHMGAKRLVIGVSGGLDSTLALLIAAKSFEAMNIDSKGIVAITMPGFGTGERTLNNAINLMEELNVSIKRIEINPAVEQHFKDIGHDGTTHDIAYENSQARERTQIIMDIANMDGGGLALGTGDLSELALGWATYNGDHMSMYNVNCSIPKTLVKDLVRYIGNEVLGGNLIPIINDILETPISPELIPSKEGELNQKTEDILGKYDLHDFFLYNMMEYGAGVERLYFMAKHAFVGIAGDNEIKAALNTFIRRFFAQQFKRSCMPDGPKVGTVALSPRGDWRMSSDVSASVWIKELDKLN